MLTRLLRIRQHRSSYQIPHSSEILIGLSFFAFFRGLRHRGEHNQSLYYYRALIWIIVGVAMVVNAVHENASEQYRSSHQLHHSDPHRFILLCFLSWIKTPRGALTRLLPDNIDHRISFTIQILICLFIFAFIAWIKTSKETTSSLFFLTIYLPKKFLMLPKRELVWIKTTTVCDGNRTKCLLD